MRVTLCCLFVLAAPSSHALVAPAGSLVTVGAKYVVTPSVPPPLDFERIDTFSPQGTFIRTISTVAAFGPLIGAIASDLAENLLGVEGTIVRINDDGSQTSLSVPLPEAGSLSLDQSGTVYVGQLRITKIAGGQIVAAYNPALVDGSIQKLAQFIDLGPDQCTLYFTDSIHPVIYRFDVCQGIPLAALPVTLPNSSASDVRALPNGQLLVADGAAGVLLIDPGSASIVRTYAIPATLLALAPDGTSFWVGAGAVAKRIDLQTGVTLATVDTGLDRLIGMTVIGEPRAAFAATLVPTLSNGMLVLLIAILVMLAWYRLSRHNSAGPILSP